MATPRRAPPPTGGSACLTARFRRPPLDGSAHAWHHPISVLLQVIDLGGESLGGQMPGFGQVLDNEEKLAVIAWFQEFWSDEIYEQWLMMGGTN